MFDRASSSVPPWEHTSRHGQRATQARAFLRTTTGTVISMIMSRKPLVLTRYNTP